MEITANTGQQGKFASQNGQPAHLFERLHAIHHFDGLTASLALFGNQPAALTTSNVVLPRVRQADPRSGFTQGRDGLL